MWLKQLEIRQFRNHSHTKIDLCEDINCFVGKNGSGKTNLLDSIYYLCIGRGAFSYTDHQHLQHGESFFTLKGDFDKNERSHQVQCTIEKGKPKTIKLNKKNYEKISHHVGNFPCVLLAPNDTDLIREGSELRRNFFDTIISQINKSYIQLLIKQKSLLKQRNSLLKSAEQNPAAVPLDLLGVYDTQLLLLFKEIFTVRKFFIEAFLPIFNASYQKMAGEKVSIDYRSQLREDNFEEAFKNHWQKDVILQRTSKGTHRDDYRFLLDEKPLKNYGSQGQQKTFVIALKMATFSIIYHQTGLKPLLLLDDIFDKLDESRIEQLLLLLNETDFGQVFITDARAERTKLFLSSLNRATTFFEVKEGRVEKKTTL